MASEKLYDLAFAYRKGKLWERLEDSQIFAVRLSDGRIGYISVMGGAGEYRAMALYIGDEGFESLRRIAMVNDYLFFDPEEEEVLMSQSCLQCAFETKDDMSEEERAEVLNYARAHGVRLAGKLAYPRFMKFQPYCMPWQLQTREEEEALGEGLEAAVWLADRLKDKNSQELGLEYLNEDMQEMLLLEKQGDQYVLGKTVLPESRPEEWPEPKSCNDVSVASLKKMKKRGTWECRIFRMPEPVQDDPEEIPVFPVTFLAVETGREFMLPVMPVKHYEQEPEALLNHVLDAFVALGVCPKGIKVEEEDERTFVFARVLCDKLGISLGREEELPDLEDAICEFMDSFEMEDDELLDEFLEMLRQIPEGKLPEEISRQLGFLKNMEGIPELLKLSEETGGKDSRKPAGKKEKPAREKGAKESYVISVSLGKGCYRHIKIAGNRTLADLHDGIMEGFDFDDDHAYGFFMDNKLWSNRDCYYTERAQAGGRTAEKARLDRLGLQKGMAFKYVFDFGDEWRFQCKVLKVTEGDAGETEIIKSKGEAPSQYGDEEDWEDF